VTNLTAFDRLAPNHKVVVRGALFAIPLLLPLAYVTVLRVVLPPTFFEIAFLGMIGYLLTPLGAEFWVPTSVLAVRGLGGGVSEASWAVGSIVLVDWFTALFLLWNFDLAERAPILGKFIDKTEARCQRFLAEKPWRQKLAVAALALYVALPVQMSGGVVGSILGRVMGIPRYRVFTIVALSSAAGAFPIAAATFLVGPPILAWARGWDASGIALVVGVVTLVAFIAAIAYMVRRSRRNHDEAA